MTTAFSKVIVFKERRPKIVCLCGSLRFIEKFKEVESQSVIEGNIVLLPCCMFVDIQRQYGAASSYKKLADDLHKRKIDLCDEVFVLNVGGYVGESTLSEIEYAKSIGRVVRYLEVYPAPISHAFDISEAAKTEPL